MDTPIEKQNIKELHLIRQKISSKMEVFHPKIAHVTV